MSCIEWGGPRNSHGYGEVRIDGVRVGAHRAAYCEANGVSLEAIQGLVIRHTCDNPGCVNPEHLLLGTQKQNVADCIARGRRSRIVKAKLTWEQVQEIRTRYTGERGEQSALAREYSVTRGNICSIVNNLHRKEEIPHVQA